MFDNFSLETSKILKAAEKEMVELKHPYVGTEHLLLALLKQNKEIKEICKKEGLTYETFKGELISIVGSHPHENKAILYTPLLKRVLNASLMDAKEDGKTTNAKYLLKAIFDEGEGIAMRILISMDVDIDAIYDQIEVKEKKKEKKDLEIIRLGNNLEEEIDLDDKVIGREKEIELMIETLLRKNKNNPLLVGDAGVGKTAIVEELVRRIKKGQVPEKLLNKKIISLELGSLVAGTKYRGEFEEKLTRIIHELEENRDIVVFIDEIHSIVNAGGAEGAINASDILKPYLARGKIKIIGATTTHEYNKYILKDKALSRRFEMIKVLEPNNEETTEILTKVKKSYEKHYNLKIKKENIKDIVKLTNKYIIDKKDPDKSLDILDSVCAHVSLKKFDFKEKDDLYNELVKLEIKKKNYVQKNLFAEATSIQEEIISLQEKQKQIKNKEKMITKEDILEIIGKKCNIPILEDKKTLVETIESHLGKTILGQDKALEKIVLNLKTHFKKEMDKPLCLLLTGNTGVGKTETVKQFAKALKSNLIRLDMSEYNLDISINRLLGASAGYVGYNDEAILNQIKMNPYSVLLIDELEKASPAIINLFLQIMDEGFVTNAMGEKLDFKNSFIFMTSNIKGSKKIGFQEEMLDYSESFSKEFLARFDDIINFKDIDKKIVCQYLKQKNIKDLSIIEHINYEKYGLREVKKAIKKYSIKE